MDKLQHLSFVSRLSTFIRRMKTGNMNPNLAWRAILFVGVIASGIIGVGAYFALNWAQSVEQESLMVKKDRDVLSPEDLHSIVQMYEVKEHTYKALHRSRPIAPNLRMGSKAQYNSVIVESATTSESAQKVAH